MAARKKSPRKATRKKVKRSPRKKATRKKVTRKRASSKKAAQALEAPHEQDANRGAATRNVKGQFVRGVSGNPGGRPVGSLGLTGRIRAVLEETREGMVIADVLAEVMVREAIKNPAKMWLFIKEFMDRDEGRSDKLDVLNASSAEEKASEVRRAVAAMEGTVPGE